MANVKISQLPSLTTMTDAAEIPVVAGGVTYQITGANLTNYFGGGLPIANGNSIINIATSDGNVTIQSASANSVWTFGTTGNLTLPGNSKIGSYAGGGVDLIAGPGGYAELGSNDELNWMWVDNTGAYVSTNGSEQWSFGLNHKITLPNGALLNDTSGDSVAFGQNAGNTSQAQHAVAIGSSAGSLYQGEDSIAIGYQAGYQNQSRGVAIGYQAGVGGTLYRSVSDAQGGSGPVTTYTPGVLAPQPSRLYVASTANIAVSQLVFGNNIQANTVVTGIFPGEDRVDITPNYTAAMSSGDSLTFVGLVIGVNDASNLVYPMRVTGTDIPANTFVQSAGCSVVTLNQYPTAPLTDGASLVFTIGQGPYSTAVGYQAGYSFQADGAVAIGYSAGRQNQSIRTVAVGEFAGYSNQSANAVAVGANAGEFTQAVNAVAVGYKAGYYQQGTRAVAIGEDAGYNVQGEDAVAIGQKAGQFSQGRFSVAIGNTAGTSGQGEQAVAIGYGAGLVSQQLSAVAIGANAASYAQGSSAVAIGELSGNTSQGANSVAVGYWAGLYNQLPAAVAIGYAAGQNFQGITAVAIGDSAGAAGTTFGILYQSGSGTAITISPNADIRIGQRITGEFVPDDTFVVNIDPTGEFLDLSQAITGTPDPGTEWTAWQPQGTAAVAIGYAAGQNLQGNSAVAVGDHSGYQDQGINAVAIGTDSGSSNQSANAIAIGTQAGFSNQGSIAVAIGSYAGNTAQGNAAVAVGASAGYVSQGNSAVAVGESAGESSQGNAAVAIGAYAGATSQGNNSIILNATGVALNQTTANTFTVAPVRNDVANIANVMFYNATTKEVTYGNAISVAGNITGGNISTGMITLTNGATITNTVANAVAFGREAGATTQKNFAVAVGWWAGKTTQGNNSVAVGAAAGYDTQGRYSIGIGDTAGGVTQSDQAIAIGASAGQFTQGFSAIAIGSQAGFNLQSANAVAIGVYAGNTNQGNAAVAIGAYAGATSQGNNSIILNATGANLNQTTANTFTVAPVRNDVANIGNVMFYNATSKEITYGNAISVAGNITGSYILGNGSQLTGITGSYGNANVVANLAALGTNPISTTGNITGGNILAGSGVISTGGNVNGATFNGNVAFATGTVSGTGNITGGNIAVSGVLLSTNTVSATGNVTGGNINTGGNISTTGNVIALDIRVGPGITGGTISALGNITSANTLNGAGLSLSGNVVSALVSAANITTTANISGGNILGTHVGNVTGTTVSTTGNITGGNLNAAGLSLSSNVVSALVSAANITTTANISGGNILGTHVGNVTGTTVSTTGNITGGNILFGTGIVSGTGNITGGNVLFGTGIVSGTGNITGGNILFGTGIISGTGNISGNTAGFAIGYRDIPQVSFSANATAALTDAGKHYYSTTAGNLALTLPDNANVAFPVGTALSLVVQAAGNVLVVTQAGTTLYFAGNSTAGNRVVSTYGMATIMKVATNTWFINGTGVT